MQKMITCKNCGRTVPGNPRLKGKQSYCNSTACQSARKNANKQEKKADDPEAFAKRQKKIMQAGVKTNPPICI